MLPHDIYSQPNAADPVLNERTVLDLARPTACAALRSPASMRRAGRPVCMSLMRPSW